jgi:hypothetical protein
LTLLRFFYLKPNFKTACHRNTYFSVCIYYFSELAVTVAVKDADSDDDDEDHHPPLKY